MTLISPMRLFLFPYAGGGVSAFASWRNLVPSWLDLVTIDNPRDYVDPPEMSISEMAKLAGDEIGERGAAPFALFGHSMGALVAFETARVLARRQQTLPRILVVAGRGAPHLPYDSTAVHELPDAEFDLELERLNGTPRDALKNVDLMEAMRPRLRRDFKACRTYAFAADEPLDITIEALGGTRDTEASEADLAAWGEHTRRACQVRMFAGGHFFIQEQPGLLVRYLSNLLKQQSIG